MTFVDPFAPRASQLSPSAGYRNPFDTGPTDDTQDTGGGGGGFWSHLPNLGGITAVKQLVSGFAALPETIAHPSRYGDFAQGLLTSVENLSATASKAIGIPGTKYNLADAVVEPGLEKLNEGTARVLGAQATKPQDIIEMSQEMGPIAALVNQVSTAAMVAAPVAGVLGSSLKAAEAAAATDAAIAAANIGTAAEASTAAAAAASAAKAAQLAKLAHAADVVAHPYRTGLGKVGELAKGAQTVMDTKAAAAVEASGDLKRPSQIVAAERDAAHAENVASHAANYEQFPDKLSEALDHPETQAAEHMVDDAAERADAARQHEVDMEEIAREREAAQTQQELKGEKPKPKENMSEAEIEAEARAREAKADKADLYADDAAKIAEREGNAAMGENGPRTSSKAALLQELIKRPAPAWALKVAESLPDSVNRKLALLKKPLDKSRVYGLARDYARYVEVAQRVARTSEAVKTSSEAARLVLDAVPGLKLKDASRIVGETVSAEMDGTAFLAAAVDEIGDLSPELKQSLHNIAMRKYKGLTAEQRALMTPEQAAEFDAHIQEAVGHWKDQKAKTVETLLGSTKGGEGLRDLLIGADEPVMSPRQLRDYRDAMAEIRRADWVMRRHPDQLMKMAGDAERSRLLATEAAEEATRARQLIGQEERAAERLGQGIAKGVRPENIAHSVGEIFQGLITSTLKGARYTYDVGLARAVERTTGHMVHVAEQWAPMTLEEFKVRGPEVIRQALENPVGSEGEVIGQGAWAGRDANLTVHVDAQGMVHGDITMSTWKGKELTPAQARSLGETYQQAAIWDNATNQPVQLSQSPMIQNLHAQYIEQTLDHNSGLNRVRNHLETTFTKLGGTTEDVDRAMRGYMMWDHSLSRTNAATHSLGDYFKQLDVRKGRGAPPTTQSLLQTVLGLDTRQGFNAARAHMSVKKVEMALKWYYDSHEYIEKLWRYNEDGSVKMMTMLNGTVRPAADVFYDLIAVTSVMANPTQNFGRALAALANMDKFLGPRKTAMVTAENLLKELDAMQPEVMRVVDLGKDTEAVLPIAKDAKGKAIEGQPGTRLSNRFLEQRVRTMLDKTSMTNDPKYKVFDVLRGDLDLSTATNADVAIQPEWWTGNAKPIKLENLPPEQLLAHADRLGITGEAVDHLRQLVDEHARRVEARDEGFKTSVTPVTKSDLNMAGRDREGVAWADRDGREVTPAEYQDLIDTGEEMMDRAAENSSRPVALHDQAIIDTMYARSREPYGGGTIDAHTGEMTKSVLDTNPETGAKYTPEESTPGYSVTVRRPTQKTVQVAADASPEEFATAWKDARNRFKDQLKLDGAQLGVFHDVVNGKGVIEIDPVRIVQTEQEVEALSAAHKADGGAYHFQTGHGYFGAHVADHLKNKGTMEQGVRDAKAAVVEQMKHGDLSAAAEPALMEYAGSSALAKLRSFRDNLANPDESLAVTLDSVMAQMYGFKSTDWDKNGVYAQHAAEIRQLAEETGLKPHSIQALLWVYTKEMTGAQDFGRLNAHAIDAKPMFDYFQQQADAGGVNAREALAFDPLEHYWPEEIDYQNEGLKARQEVKRLLKEQKALQARHLDLSPDQADDLAYYQEQIAEDARAPRETQVTVEDAAGRRTETRREIHGSKQDVNASEGRMNKYKSTVLPEIQQAIADGNVEQAREILDSYLARQRRSIVGDEGKAFPEVAEATRRDAGNATTPEGSTAYQAQRYFDERGDGPVPAPNTLNEATPGYTTVYRGSHLPEPQGQAGSWWTTHRPTGRQGYAHWQETRVPTESVNRLLESVGDDAAREGRGSMPVKGKDIYLDPTNPAHEGWMGNARPHTPGAVAEPTAAGELLQMFGKKIRGSMSVVPDKSGKLIMRLFEGADLGTLFHEGAHLLRQILPEEHLWTMEMNYPGILDKTLTPRRIASEERFVGDLMYWMRGADRDIHAPMGMGDTFDKIGATLEDQWAAGKDTQAMPREVTQFWDDMFLPELQRPNAMVDPVAQQAVIPAGVETKRFRWESEAEFARRARQYGEARERIKTAKFKAHLKEQRAAKATDAALRMEALLADGKTAAITEAEKLRGQAGRTLDRLAKQLDKPTLSRVPAAWQPLYEAVLNLHAEAILDESGTLAEALSEIPETFSDVLRFAAERGFEPTHVQDLTWEQASRSLFDHVTLGRREETAGTRRQRNLGLHKAGLADRSIEALSAGLVQATHEVYTNKLISFIEENYAQDHPQGIEIPEGWHEWDKDRAFIMTGERAADNARVATTSAKIIPDGVHMALESMSKNYDHWTYRAVTRVTSPWRTLVLTMSPKWYINNFVGNVVLATTEGGIRPKSWIRAFNQWKKGEIPLDVPTSSGVFSMLDDESTVLNRPIKDAAKNEGVKAAWSQTKHRIARMNEAVDEIARAYVYDVHLSKGRSREFALTRASEAMVDYGNLSPFERSAVRAVVPFYAWQKGIFKLLTHFPTDHPVATGLGLQLGLLHQEMMQDRLGGSIPDAYMGLYDIKGLGVTNVRAFNPFQDSTQLLTADGIGNSINPYIKIFMQMATPPPQPGTTVAGVGPTGQLEQQVDPGKALGFLGASLPQARLAEQQFGGADVYGHDPSALEMVTSFLGKPRGYDPNSLEAIRQRVEKARQDALLLNSGGRTFSNVYMPSEEDTGTSKPTGPFTNPFG